VPDKTGSLPVSFPVQIIKSNQQIKDSY